MQEHEEHASLLTERGGGDRQERKIRMNDGEDWDRAGLAGSEVSPIIAEWNVGNNYMTFNILPRIIRN